MSIWIRERDLRNAEPHSGNARIIVDECDAKTAQINGEVLVEFTRVVAETCKWHTEPSSGNDRFTTSCGTVLYCEPPNIKEYDDAEFCCFCGKVISHE